jgi:hypothetical protein
MSSTGLSALSQVPTMSNVWLPRWFVKDFYSHMFTKGKNILKLRITYHI